MPAITSFCSTYRALNKFLFILLPFIDRVIHFLSLYKAMYCSYNVFAVAVPQPERKKMKKTRDHCVKDRYLSCRLITQSSA